MDEKENNNLTPRKRNKQVYLTVVLLIMVICAALLSNLLMGNKNELSGELQKSEETQLSSNQNQSIDPDSFRKFNDKTIEITKYELFYRNSNFYSKEAVEFFSLTETIEKYALFHHLEQNNYKWDDETRDEFRERIKTSFEYDKKNPDLNAYFEKMFEELQITEEDYIEDYLLVNKELDMLYQDQFNKGIGLDEMGGYPSGEAERAYSELIGVTEEKLNELAEKIPEPLEPMEPQPNLPFITDESILKVTTNEEGEYIFIDSVYFYTGLDDVTYSLLFDLERDVVKEELSRHSLNKYKSAAASYKSDDPKKMEAAKQLSLILEILERTVEMELN